MVSITTGTSWGSEGTTGLAFLAWRSAGIQIFRLVADAVAAVPTSATSMGIKKITPDQQEKFIENSQTAMNA